MPDKPAEAACCIALASGKHRVLVWSLALACGIWLFPHSQPFMSLQASLIIQRTSPLRSQSFPAKASAWTGPLTPVQTPRGSRDEVRSCTFSPQLQHNLQFFSLAAPLPASNIPQATFVLCGLPKVCSMLLNNPVMVSQACGTKIEWLCRW